MISSYPATRYSLNICAWFLLGVSAFLLLLIILLGDVGGQRTLRPYWRNYFEQTDALVWVVDSSDRMRIEDCKHELHSLLMEDVRQSVYFMFNFYGLRPFPAISRGVFACVCQQRGFAWFYDWRRNSRCMGILSSPTAVNLKSNITPFPSQALNLPSITTHHWKIWPCSAITGRNLVHGLEWVVNDIAGRLYYSSNIDE